MTLVWDITTTEGTVNQEVTGTLNFKKPDVRAVYIDWDDGTSNKKTEANYQWFTTTEPVSSTTLTHTYNATGTFNPIVQTVNSRGFISRYYGADTAANVTGNLVPYTQDTDIAALTVNDEAPTSIMRTTNRNVLAGIDNSVYEMNGPSRLYVAVMPTLTDTELNYFSPIEIDLTLELSLNLLSGAQSLATNIQSTNSGGDLIVKKLTCILSGANLTGNSRMTDVLASGTATQTPLISGASVSRVLEVKYKNPKYVGASGKTSYTENAALNKLKIGFFNMSRQYSNQNVTGRALPICYVTAGDPIKRSDEVDREVVLDFSQSRAAASNVSMENYFYDNGKWFTNPINRWIISGGSTTTTAAITDAAATSIAVTSTAQFPTSGTAYIDETSSNEVIEYTGTTATTLYGCTRGARGTNAITHDTAATVTVGEMEVNAAASASNAINNNWQFIYPSTPQTIKKLNYTYALNPFGLTLDATYNPWKVGTATWTTSDATTYMADQFPLDNFGRFMDQFHLVRAQGNTSLGRKSVFNFPAVYRITPIRSWAWNPGSSAVSPDASLANARSNPTKVLDSGASDADSDSYDYTNFNRQNTSGSLISLSGANDHVWKDEANATRQTPLQEYLLLLFPKKTNNIFFNMSNYAPYLQSDTDSAAPWGIDSVSLLKIENSGTNVQDAFWVPVSFEDGTKSAREIRNTTDDKYEEYSVSLSKSGPVTFDMVDGWDSTTIEGLCGGQFHTNTVPTTTGSYDFGICSGTVSGSVQNGTLLGDYFVVTGTTADDISSKLLNNGIGNDDIGSMKYMAVITSPAAYTGNALWLSKDGEAGWDGDDTVYLHIGDSTETLRDDCQSLTGDLEFVIRRINIYDAVTGFSKVYLPSGGTSNQLLGVDSQYPTTAWNNNFMFLPDDARGDLIADGITMQWQENPMYAVKIGLSGTMALGSDDIHPELWNIMDGNAGDSAIIKVVDNSAYNLNSLAITSSIGLGRGSNFFKAITRKGKVIIVKTGLILQEVGFTSVALGDEGSATAFDAHGPSTLYGHLHSIRNIQAHNCRVYWDEPQKDGTFVRLFGVVQNLNETSETGGSRRVVKYTFTLGIESIALLDANGKLMTDVFPLGGIADEKTYT